MKKKFLIFVSVFALLLSLSSVTAFAAEDPSASPDPTPIPMDFLVYDTVFSDGRYYKIDSFIDTSAIMSFIFSDSYFNLRSDLPVTSFLTSNIYGDDYIYSVRVVDSGDIFYFRVNSYTENSDRVFVYISPVPDLPFISSNFRGDVRVYLSSYIANTSAFPAVSGDFLKGVFISIGNVLYSALNNWALLLFMLVIPIAGIVIGLVFRVRKRK